MLYAPSPYSSGTEVSVYEQDAYPTIDVTSSISSDADFNHETTTLPNATDEDNFFFLSQLQNDAAVLQQYNNNNNNNSNNSNNNLVDSMDESNNNLDNNNNNNVYISYDNNFEENKNSNSKNLDDIIHEEDEDEEDEDEEEEEEEENNTYNNINNHYHYLQQAYPFDPSDQSLYSSPTITDDDFETANRAFHATINKFSRQTYPEHRRRAPYSFLENWHLHSMYSKSQQILLGIAHVRPMVLLSGDDFMFTPPLLQQEDEEEYMDDNNLHHDHQLRYLDQPTQMDWIDGEEMFEDDGDILDDGIVIMSAPDPPNISHHTQQHHHHYNNIINNNNTNNRNDHDDHDEPLISHSTTSTILNENAWMKNTVGGNLLQQQEEEEEASTENDSLYFSAGFSSELVHWYRSSDRGRPPSTIMEVSFEDDPIENNNDNNNNNINEAVDHVEYEITEVEGDVDINTNHEQYFLDNNSSGSYINVETEYIDKDSNSRNDTISISNQLTTSEGLKPLDHQHTHTIYQSLTDITPPIQSTPVTITDVTNNEEDHDDDGEVEDEEVLHKYGSISECNKDQFASTSTHHDYYYSEHYPFNYANFSNQLTATSDLVLTIASEYHSSKSNTMIDTTITENNNNNKKEMSFIQCLLCIWQVFFLTAELALAMLLGQHDQQQQLPVIMNNPKKSNRYRLNNNTNNAVTEHILPF